METYSRIGLLRRNVNLQSYWTTTKPCKLTVVLNITKLCKLTVVLNYYEAKETYSRIGLLRTYIIATFYNYTIRKSFSQKSSLGGGLGVHAPSQLVFVTFNGSPE